MSPSLLGRSMLLLPRLCKPRPALLSNRGPPSLSCSLSPLKVFQTVSSGLPRSRSLGVQHLTTPAPAAAAVPRHNNAVQSVLVHDRAPLDVGIMLETGFFVMVPARSRLPYTRREHLSNVFDYDTSTLITICCRPSMLEVPSALRTVSLHGRRAALKEDTKFTITMHMSKALGGTFTVRDTWTGEEASVEFDAGGIAGSRSIDTPLLAST